MIKKKYFFLILLSLSFYIDLSKANENKMTITTIQNNKDKNIVLDGVYYDWYVYYTLDKEEEKKCYIATFSKRQQGNYKQKRQAYIMITTFKAKNAEEISVHCGYKFKIKSTIFLGIGNKQFRLQTKEDMAWASTSEEDKAIIEELLSGDDVRVKGETIDGKYTIDHYSIKGISRAYKRMLELCK